MNDTAPTTFDLDAFLAIPRVGEVDISPDGQRLVASIATVDENGHRFDSALWEVDPRGARPARRLTRSAKGESSPKFAPDGSILFTSPRPDPDDAEGPDCARLWCLPASGGEAYLVTAPDSGVESLAVAGETGRVVWAAGLHPEAADPEEDAEWAKARTDAKVTAQLFEQYPMRFWDAWLGPRQRQLFTSVAAPAPDSATAGEQITSDAGFVYEQTGFDVAADGRFVVTSRRVFTDDLRQLEAELVRIELDGDGRVTSSKVLHGARRCSYGAPAVSPDGQWVAAIRSTLGTPDRASRVDMVLIDAVSGEERDLSEVFTERPSSVAWAPDNTALFVTANDDGRTPVFRVDVGPGQVTQLTAEGVYSSVCVAPDGGTVYAVRADMDQPPHVVAMDASTPSTPTVLHRPPMPAPVPGTVERVETTAADSERVPGWLVLPPEAADGPVPLVVFIHGGPVSSWVGWIWRWNPHLMAARGWAVLLPDPALSTGYGQEYIQRGWARWGAEPYTDLMALVDAVEERSDIDASRTAAMGGSFGGYMANWVAGHTDRFDAIVTHASLWNLEAFHGTTDLGPWWENEFGDVYDDPSTYREWSPHRHVADISTPMLVIHGEKDYRVPVSEGLMLWTDLMRHSKEAKYLHFPDENHWILQPQHTRIWYETVWAFLDHHVRGGQWQRPNLL